ALRDCRRVNAADWRVYGVSRRSARQQGEDEKRPSSMRASGGNPARPCSMHHASTSATHHTLVGCIKNASLRQWLLLLQGICESFDRLPYIGHEQHAGDRSLGTRSIPKSTPAVGEDAVIG